NYKKGHVRIDGMDITIENPKGSIRSGVDANGKQWSVTMNNTYGYIRGTRGVDGDHIDIFLSDNPESGNVYVVDQIRQDTGEFDESKVLYGFNSMEEARQAYLSNYEKDWKVGVITEVTKEEFKKWIDSSWNKVKPFSEYANVKKLEVSDDGNAADINPEDIRFREGDTGYSEFAQKYNLNEADIRKYAQSIKANNLGGASYAFKSIKRNVLLQNPGLSLGQFVKVFSPIKEELYNVFGNLDSLRNEYIQNEIEERNIMEAARKRAEDEAEAERIRLFEFEQMTDEEMDNAYFKAVEANDERRMRDIINESERRNGYISTDEFKMSHRAPSFDDEGYNKSMVDVANNKDDIRGSLNEQMRMNRDKNREESATAINKALSDIEKEGKATVTIYRAVPKSIKERNVRNGDWVTFSESYAKQHGNHALEGNYRIIKEDVPAENLYWDGNDINEWGYDDRSDYRYRNTKNNRKLNDLITRDDKGNIIPPSQRFNSRKSDIRFRFIGEQGAARLDEAEEATTRLDNLSIAREMEKSGKDAGTVKLATGWERGADGKWRYETIDIEYIPNGKARKSEILENKEWYSELEALSDKLFNGETLTEAEQKRFDELSDKADEVREQYENTEKTYLDDYVKDKELFTAYPSLKQTKVMFVDNPDLDYSGKADHKGNQITVNLAKAYDVKSVLSHEIQHLIQSEEGFASGGNKSTARQLYDKFIAWSWRNELVETQKENPELSQSEVENTLIEEYKEAGMEDMIPSARTRTKGFNLFARGYDKEGYEDAWNAVSSGKIPLEINGQEYNVYNKLSGEVEARNVERRLNMTPEERRQSLAAETEDVAREDQIFINSTLLSDESVSSSSENIDIINEKFNEDLGKFSIENADSIYFNLGMPSEKLLAAGLAYKPIRLHGSKIVKKMKKHGFKHEELKNLPKAIADPIAVFDNLGREGNRSILTELKTENGNFLVTLDLGKGMEADFSIESSIVGKN
ncbi:MAG: LPD23 domain-containing protein, partial [Phocaeicola sp.]